jgi:glycerol-3-phosphate acyltransferase PlsY
MLGIMAACSLLIIAKHHPNIRRLMAGKENKFAAGRR